MMGRFVFFLLALAGPLWALPLRAEIAIQTVTSPGGITAWLVESHDIPFTALEIRFRGGTSLDAPGKRGAVNLMTALIEEGAGDLDAQGFAAARDDLAASFRFSPGDDEVSVSARFLTENREPALVRNLLTKLISRRVDVRNVPRNGVQTRPLRHQSGSADIEYVEHYFVARASSPCSFCEWNQRRQTSQARSPCYIN